MIPPFYLSQNADFYQQLFDSSRIGFWELWLPSMKCVFRGQNALYAMTGRALPFIETNFGHHLKHICHPDDRAHVNRLLQAVTAGETIVSVEYRVKNCVTGQWVWVYSFGGVAPDSADDNLHLVGGMQNVQESKAYQQAQQQICEADQRAKLMLEKAPICCNFWDSSFRNIDCNQEAVRLFGFESKQAYLEHFYELSPPLQPDGSSSAEAMRQNMSRAFETGWLQFEWLHQKLDGDPIPTQVTLVRSQWQNQSILLAYVRDLRRLKKLSAEMLHTQQQLSLARDAAEQSASAQSRFLANMSHELRTPINAVLGMVQLLYRTNPNPEQQFYLEHAIHSSKSLLRIINDILDYTKIESGRMGMECAIFSLETVLQNLSDTILSAIVQTDLQFSFSIAPEVPYTLLGDPFRLEQVLLNLLNNALKFTSNGKVDVAISLHHQAMTFAILHFAVSDTGIGISREQIEHLFTPFSQADSSISRKYGGTGLGLSIAQHLVQMMQGEIWCESVPGEGSTFHFTARFALPDAPSQQSPRLDALQVLLLGNTPFTRSIRLQLQLLRCKVDDRYLGLSPQQLPIFSGACNAPGLIMMDYQQPLRHIPQAVHRLHQCSMRGIPILAAVSAEELASATSMLPGEVVLIDKPFSLSTLYQTILHVWGEQVGSFKSLDPGLPDTTATHAYHYLQGARILLAEDNEINQIVMLELLKAEGCVVDVAKNGIEAIALLEERENYQLILMDVQMPELDGLAATRIIRQQSRWRAIPILAMTAHAMTGDRELSLESGMDDHITKPVEPALLYSTLERWLAPHRAVASKEE